MTGPAFFRLDWRIYPCAVGYADAIAALNERTNSATDQSSRILLVRRNLFHDSTALDETIGHL